MTLELVHENSRSQMVSVVVPGNEMYGHIR